jgi:hypothetical protein
MIAATHFSGGWIIVTTNIYGESLAETAFFGILLIPSAYIVFIETMLAVKQVGRDLKKSSYYKILKKYIFCKKVL